MPRMKCSLAGSPDLLTCILQMSARGAPQQRVLALTGTLVDTYLSVMRTATILRPGTGGERS